MIMGSAHPQMLRHLASRLRADWDVPLQAIGQELTVGSNANVYGGVDWVAMAMSANETADLMDPQVGG